MIDWITAIIPCHHDERIFGGSVSSINLDQLKIQPASTPL